MAVKRVMDFFAGSFRILPVIKSRSGDCLGLRDLHIICFTSATVNSLIRVKSSSSVSGSSFNCSTMDVSAPFIGRKTLSRYLANVAAFSLFVLVHSAFSALIGRTDLVDCPTFLMTR